MVYCFHRLSFHLRNLYDECYSFYKDRWSTQKTKILSQQKFFRPFLSSSSCHREKLLLTEVGVTGLCWCFGMWCVSGGINMNARKPTFHSSTLHWNKMVEVQFYLSVVLMCISWWLTGYCWCEQLDGVRTCRFLQRRALNAPRPLGKGGLPYGDTGDFPGGLVECFFYPIKRGSTEWNVRLGQSNILHIKVEYERPLPTCFYWNVIGSTTQSIIKRKWSGINSN